MKAVSPKGRAPEKKGGKGSGKKNAKEELVPLKRIEPTTKNCPFQGKGKVQDMIQKKKKSKN